MATKIEVLNDVEYAQYVMIGMIQAARNVLAESNSTPRANLRKDFAKRILSNPQADIETFKSLMIVSFDTSNWGTFSEQQKIDGGTILAAQVFNEAGGIYN